MLKKAKKQISALIHFQLEIGPSKSLAGCNSYACKIILFKLLFVAAPIIYVSFCTHQMASCYGNIYIMLMLW